MKFDIWYLIFALLGAWLVFEAILIYPYHLAYFNEIVGGPENGYRVLADSNVDWGQDIKRASVWLKEHHIDQAYLSVFAGSRPERYGIRALALPGPYEQPDQYGFRRFAPEPGIYIISASSWQGLRLANRDTYDWFRRQKPVARIGYSLFVYDVPPEPETEKWAAVCYSPHGPIDGAGLTAGLGRADMRSIFFDCRDAWVYVHNGGPGYYIVPVYGDPTIADEMMLGRASPLYRDRGDPTTLNGPGFTLYRWDGEAEASAQWAGLTKPPGGTFDFGPAALLGYRLEGSPWVAGGILVLTTWWRASGPAPGALSAYAHLMDGERQVAGADRLGVPPEMWQTGDIIVQRHSIKLPTDLQPGDYALYVGLYLTPNGPRLRLGGGALPSGDDHPLLTMVRVIGR